MLKKTKSILVPIVIIAVIISMTIVSVGGKSGYKKRVDAWSGTVKVTYNNEDKTRQVSPIVINGRTYLPLKSVSTLFGKSVTWNNSSKTVAIADTEDSTTISQLQNKIIVLEAELAKYEGGSTEELEELAEDLDYEYYEYKDADFEISLKGNEDDINVIIETEKSDWNDISSRNQKSYIQNIVDDILDEFEDANIKGSVRDDSKVLDQFSVTSGGKVKLVSNIDNLEDTLNESLEDDEFGRLDDIDND
ncbi:MAG: copper amine oxidase N-terminal domain-containing protein, partial [Clostridia bacterium]|nr:copper amine oxidase N-terminal domain-containing protein [Clostridia bacterium]